jgi:hypothetical protein
VSYGDLTEAERAHWNEYTNLRGISDWPGFDEDQDQRRADSRTWLQERRKEIWHLAQDAPNGDGNGWNYANRRARYEFLKDDNLNKGAPKHEYRLPAPGTMTDTEKVYVEEREVYLIFNSTTDAQKQRKTANLNWLQDRRKQLWHLIQDSTDKENKANDRQNRYNALCVATHHGKTWESYEKSHNKYGEPYTPTTGAGDSRSDVKRWLESYLGVSENPPNSNKGHEQPSKWQDRVYGSDGVAWCACFAGCSAWDNGVSGSVTAGVANNTDLAKKGQGIYRGYTTDPSKVHAGDHAFIGSSHTGVIYDASNGTTIEGNTSPGSEGSQYNGGCVAKRQRGWSYWSGFGLVRFDD